MNAVLPAATHDGHVWIARFGRLVDKRVGDQHGILYDTPVNRIRAAFQRTSSVLSPRRPAFRRAPNGKSLPCRMAIKFLHVSLVIANGLNSVFRVLYLECRLSRRKPKSTKPTGEMNNRGFDL
jgi:hypothetical protein